MKGFSGTRCTVLALAIAGTLVSGCDVDTSIALHPTVGIDAAAMAVVPLKPNFNLEMILRPPGGSNAGDAFGHVEFRQDNDAALIFDLDVWVRGLEPNTHYRFQRAVDTVINDDCTSTAWLTIGKGAVPQDIVTDDRGTAKQDLFRLSTVGPGTTFDLHTRIVTATAVPTVVLESECYQFFVR